LALEYSLEIQAQIPAVLATIHNFIRSHDPDDDEPRTVNGDTFHDHFNDEGDCIYTPEEEVDERCDQITLAMWNDYQQVCEERGIGLDELDEPSSSDDKLDELYGDS
jgi:hypothetical protein